MKTIPVSLILTGFLTPLTLYGQSDGEGRRKAGPDARRPEHPHFAQAWKAADMDGDGFISRDEFAGMRRVQSLPEEKRQRLFERLDKDSDGRLGREELCRMGRSQENPRPVMRRLWELDVDRSGGVSLDEFKVGELFGKLPPERQLEIFRRLDTDGDGMITPKDRPEPPFRRDEGMPHQRRGPGPDKAMPKPMEPQAMLRELDKDGDGALSFEEFRIGPAVCHLSEDEQEDRFESIDRNKDLKLTPEDFLPPNRRADPKRMKNPPPARD